MSRDRVSVVLVTADRTRKAQVTLPRRMRVADIIKASHKRWSLALGIHYNVINLTTNRQLLPDHWLTEENVADGDMLMLQPIATHGGGG